MFWASAPDAFEVLAGQSLLDDVADLANKRQRRPRSATIRSTTREGCYLGQALAGYGLMWNTRYLAGPQAAGAERNGPT